MERVCEICHHYPIKWADDDGMLRCNDCHNHWPANPDPFANIANNLESFKISNGKGL